MINFTINLEDRKIDLEFYSNETLRFMLYKEDTDGNHVIEEGFIDRNECISLIKFLIDGI